MDEGDWEAYDVGTWKVKDGYFYATDEDGDVTTSKVLSSSKTEFTLEDTYSYKENNYTYEMYRKVVYRKVAQ